MIDSFYKDYVNKLIIISFAIDIALPITKLIVKPISKFNIKKQNRPIKTGNNK